MWPQGKHILLGLKEYQKNSLKSKIYISRTTVRYTCYVTPKKTPCMCAKAI